MMTDMPDITHDEPAIIALLQSARRIAVVGASDKPARDSNRVFHYLRAHGYDAVPVNPVVEEVHGVRALPDLKAAQAHWEEGIEVVDVFRNRDAAPAVTQAAIQVGAPAIWFQFGTDHPDAVKTALDAGMTVVADRCMKVEHQRLIG